MKYLIGFIVMVSVFMMLSVRTNASGVTSMERAEACIEELGLTQHYPKIVSATTLFGHFWNQYQKIYIIVETPNGWPIYLVAKRKRSPFRDYSPWRIIELDRVGE